MIIMHQLATGLLLRYIAKYSLAEAPCSSLLKTSQARERGVLPYAYWICAARETPISVPEHIIFTNYQQNPVWSITILYVLADFPFQRPSFSKYLFNVNRSIASHGRSARTQSVRQRRGLAAGQSACQTLSGRFRRLAFSRSKWLKLDPEPRIFTLDRELVPEPGTYLPKFGVSPPPPPPGSQAFKQTQHGKT